MWYGNGFKTDTFMYKNKLNTVLTPVHVHIYMYSTDGFFYLDYCLSVVYKY